MAIRWHSGEPPNTQWGKRFLVIATPLGRNLDAAADNRPDLFIAHYGKAEDSFVPARIAGMSQNEARPSLKIEYWADIDLPPGVEIRSLTGGDIEG